MAPLSDISARVRGFFAAHWVDVCVATGAVLVGVVAFWAAASSAPLDVGPVRLDLSVRPSLEGGTVVHIPPFGAVSAATHAGPVELRVRVDEIDVEGTRALMSDSSLASAAVMSGRIPPQLPVRRLPEAIARILGGGLIAALLAAAVVALAARRSRLVVAISCLATLVAIALPLSVAAATWDAEAFKEPTLRGGLTYAPGLVDMFSTRLANIERLRDQAEKVARDLASYYADDRSLASGGSMAGTYRVLHVTDQHLDPVGAELAAELARSYEVSLVIDTGDMSVLGAEIEGRAIESLVDTSVPRVYVPGNHDSAATIDALRAIPGVTVVATDTVEIDGLRIFGVEDPFSRGFGLEPEPDAIEDATRAAYRRFSAAMRSGETTPDIVAIHNPAMEEPFIGRVPVILSGHTHAARLYRSQGTVRLNSGTLGGMPYDPEITGRRVVPYGASVLYYTATVPRRLLAVDELAVHSDRSTTVHRTVLDDPDLP